MLLTKSKFGRPVRSILIAMVGAFLTTAIARAEMILVNPGFETGTLGPWFQDRDVGGSVNWNVTNTDAQTGAYSAMNDGNKELRQNFQPVSTDSIVEVSFWAKHPVASVRLLGLVLFYDDSTESESTVSTTNANWHFFDVTNRLDPSKELIGFSIFGTSLGSTFFDDATIRTFDAIPEPSASMLICVGSLVCSLSRRNRSRTREARSNMGDQPLQRSTYHSTGSNKDGY